MNKTTIYLYFFLILLSACEKQAFFDAGEISEKEFLVDDFGTLEVQDIFDIELQNASVNRVIASGGANLLENLEIYSKEGKLFLDNNNKYEWSRKYKRIKLIIQATDLKHINIRIPCKITTNAPFVSDKLTIIDWEKFSEIDIQVEVNQFSMHVSSDNAGIYKISGKTEFASIRPWGSAFILADQLQSKNVSVYHRSIGDCYVNASEKLDIQLEEKGNLYYLGNPEINIINHTKGEIIPVEESIR